VFPRHCDKRRQFTLPRKLYGARFTGVRRLRFAHTKPATVAGAAALLNYYVEAETAKVQIFPELLDDNDNWLILPP
jgi:hypothetical protein